MLIFFKYTSSNYAENEVGDLASQNKTRGMRLCRSFCQSLYGKVELKVKCSACHNFS